MNKNTVKALMYLVLVLLLARTFWELWNFENNITETNKRICEKELISEFSGVVISTYKSENRGTFIFEIETETGIEKIYNFCIVYPEAYISQGDSIVKIANRFEYHIFKNKDLKNVTVVKCESIDCD